MNNNSKVFIETIVVAVVFGVGELLVDDNAARTLLMIAGLWVISEINR